jgi:hypothetical protein
MRKALMLGVGVWFAAACVVALIASPTPAIRSVSAVFLVWFISNVLNWIGLIVMATACALSLGTMRTRDVHLRHAIYLGMQKRSFWWAYWGSGVALVVNTLAPFALFFYVSAWIAAGAVAINLFLNAGSPAFRIWIWRIHSQDEIPVA